MDKIYTKTQVINDQGGQTPPRLPQKRSRTSPMEPPSLRRTRALSNIADTTFFTERIIDCGLEVAELLKELAEIQIAVSQRNEKRVVDLCKKTKAKVFAHRAMATVYFDLQKFSKAEHHFVNLQRLDQNAIKALDLYSSLLWQQREEVKLSALSEKLKELDNHAPEAWISIGNLCSLQKSHESAIEAFQKALKFDAYYSYAYTLIAHEYVSSQKYDSAALYYRSALRVNPRCLRSLCGLAEMFRDQEKFQSALHQYEEAATVCESSTIVTSIGFNYFFQNKFQDALKHFERAFILDPENPNPKIGKATVLARMDKLDEALEILLEMQRLHPDESNIYYLLGRIYEKKNEKEKSIRYLLDAAALHGKNRPAFLSIYIDKVAKNQSLPSI